MTSPEVTNPCHPPPLAVSIFRLPQITNTPITTTTTTTTTPSRLFHHRLTSIPDTDTDSTGSGKTGVPPPPPPPRRTPTQAPFPLTALTPRWGPPPAMASPPLLLSSEASPPRRLATLPTMWAAPLPFPLCMARRGWRTVPLWALGREEEGYSTTGGLLRVVEAGTVLEEGMEAAGGDLVGMEAPG